MFTQASQELRTAQTTYTATPNPTNKETWHKVKNQFEMAQELYNMTQNDHKDLKYHKYGNKPGKLLAHLTRDRHQPISIPKIKKQNGTYATDVKDINTVFQQYYQIPYSEQKSDTESRSAYLDDHQLPTLTEQQLAVLNALIANKDIQDTITQLTNNKSPGADGYTAEYFKMMNTTVTPHLLTLYNQMIK